MLFKTIVGLEPLDGGELTIETVKISYVDQSRAGIDPIRRCGGCLGGGLTSSRLATSRCLRVPTSQPWASRPISRSLPVYSSGGERNRLNLAPHLKQGGNLLPAGSFRPTT